MKINLAVGELPRIAGTPAGLQSHHRGLVQLTTAAGEDGRRPGRAPARASPPRRPHVEICVPSALDPSLAPEGKHVITLGVRSQPYRLAGSDWDAERERVADRLVDELATMIPNLPGSVIARQVLTPLDLERTLALTGGHHLHGDMSPDQLGPLRPVLGPRRLPDPDRRPVSLRRRNPPRRRRHRRQRPQLRDPGACRRAAAPTRTAVRRLSPDIALGTRCVPSVEN